MLLVPDPRVSEMSFVSKESFSPLDADSISTQKPASFSSAWSVDRPGLTALAQKLKAFAQKLKALARTEHDVSRR